MKRALTAAEMQAVEMAAVRCGVSLSTLMENAGQALANAAAALAGSSGRFFILCGMGNNGGDGLVAARSLHARDLKVHVELMGSPESLKEEPLRKLKALQECGVPLGIQKPAGTGDVVIDALFGTGLSRAPEGKHAEAIHRIATWRSSGAKVLSADLPSGLHSDTGEALHPCVIADATLTFGFLKRGLTVEPGASCCGSLELADIGIPQQAHRVLEEAPVYLLEEADARSRFPKRRANSHKGTFGHVLVVAGSRGKTGAAALAGLAALRGGAGCVTIATRSEALSSVMHHAPELMGVDLAHTGPLGMADLNSLLKAAADKAAVVFGPGIFRGEETGQLIANFLKNIAIPCVLDADGINAMVGQPDILKQANGAVLLTPHPGEMARLLGLTPAQVQKNRLALARQFAQENQTFVALKGARTLIACKEGTVFINPTGTAGMASAGTGDVLAGLCGALVAQGLSCDEAAAVGCFAHGLAGARAVQRRGQAGLIASDLLDGLGEVWASWDR